MTDRARTPGNATLGSFEERLLADLKIVVAQRASTDSAQRAGSARRGFDPASGRRSTRPAGPRRPRRLPLASAIAAAAGLAVAASATAIVLVASPAGRPARAHAPRLTLAAFLGHAAAAARSGHTASLLPGQVFYQLVHGGVNVAGSGFHYECAVMWYRSPATGATGFPSLNQRCPADGRVRYPGTIAAGPEHGYPDPGSLPTQPAALLTRLRADAGRGAAYWRTNSIDAGNAIMAGSGLTTRTAVVFTLIERLLQVPISARLRAALYEATAQIPGVDLARHVTDMAGRPGVGVVLSSGNVTVNGRPDTRGPVTCEFILDPVSYRFLGLEWRFQGPKPKGDPHRPVMSYTAGFAVIRTGLIRPTGS